MSPIWFGHRGLNYIFFDFPDIFSIEKSIEFQSIKKITLNFDALILSLKLPFSPMLLDIPVQLNIQAWWIHANLLQYIQTIFNFTWWSIIRRHEQNYRHQIHCRNPLIWLDISSVAESVNVSRRILFYWAQPITL